MRAARALSTRARQHWEAAWAELDVKAPADATSGDALEAALADLPRRIERNRRDPVENHPLVEVSDLAGRRDGVRERLHKALAGRSLESVVAWETGPQPAGIAPLVLIEPFHGLGTQRRARMRDQLAALADHHEVIVIVRDKTNAR